MSESVAQTRLVCGRRLHSGMARPGKRAAVMVGHQMGDDRHFGNVEAIAAHHLAERLGQRVDIDEVELDAARFDAAVA